MGIRAVDVGFVNKRNQKIISEANDVKAAKLQER